MDNLQILSKAKATIYKHPTWYYNNTKKSVFECVSYYVDSGDFELTLRQSVKSPSDVQGLVITHSYEVKDVVAYCKANIDTHWKYLTIKGDGGSDSGKLKIQTFIALSENKSI